MRTVKWLIAVEKSQKKSSTGTERFDLSPSLMDAMGDSSGVFPFPALLPNAGRLFKNHVKNLRCKSRLPLYLLLKRKSYIHHAMITLSGIYFTGICQWVQAEDNLIALGMEALDQEKGSVHER